MERAEFSSISESPRLVKADIAEIQELVTPEPERRKPLFAVSRASREAA